MAKNKRDTDTGVGGVPDTGHPSSKAKVMIYVPHALHRAVKRRAVDEGRSASDLFAEAAHRYLYAAEAPVVTSPIPTTIQSVLSDTSFPRLVEAVEQQGRLLHHLSGRIEMQQAVPSNDTPSRTVGVKSATAMRTMLGMLRRSGADGVDSNELSKAMLSDGFKSGTTENAKAVLRDAGLARYEGRRWYLADV